MSHHAIRSLIVGLLLATGSCRDEATEPAWLVNECGLCDDPQWMERCGDGLDNDEDGLTDCMDADCRNFQACADRRRPEYPSECPAVQEGVEQDSECTALAHQYCADALDNDENGFTDCLDYACQASAACRPAQRGNEDDDRVCRDGLDNDWDGDFDCRDEDCAEQPFCESNDLACSDGIDNDNNGFVDCRDYGCTRSDSVTVCP